MPIAGLFPFSHKSLGSPVTLHVPSPIQTCLRDSSSFLLVSRQVLSILESRSSTPSSLISYQRRQEGTQRVNHKNRHRDSRQHITMAQVRDATFNPSSPHSSSAGGDSYKHEGTPETRLTVFSPEDTSVKSNRLLTAIGLNAPSDHSVHPVHFHHANTMEGYGNPSAAVEKDPFVSTTTAVLKAEQKLSPTASAFRPVAVPLVAHGSLAASPGMSAGLGANRQLFAPQAIARFSSELGVSRCLVLYSPSRPVTVTDVEDYLAVRNLNSLFPCRCAVDNQRRSWSDLDRRAMANAMRSHPRARSFSIFPTSGTPATPMTTSSLVLPTGVPSTLPRLSFTAYESLPISL